jgi:hypothetical protein
MIRKFTWLFCALFYTCCFSVSAQTAADTLKQYTGKWVGTLVGDVSGKCEMTIKSTDDGHLTGQIVVNSSVAKAIPLP